VLKSFKVLIVGDVRRGKTTLTSRLVDVLAKLCGEDKITVLDFAPDYGGVGSRVRICSRVRVLRPEGLRAPRLMARNCSELWEYVRINRSLTEDALREYMSNPTPVLVINDLSIHLHTGDLNLLLKVMELPLLFIANSYYGDTLRDECGLSVIERRAVEELMSKVDYIWRL
jgi:hypothetical protein